jgi:YndJ-like protein
MARHAATPPTVTPFAVGGAAAWLIVVVIGAIAGGDGVTLTRLLVALSPLAIAPIALEFIAGAAHPTPRARLLWSRARMAWPAGSLAAAAAILLRPGPVAGALAIAFAATAAVATVAAVVGAIGGRGWPIRDLLPAAALAALFGGGVWLVIDRFGWSSLGGLASPLITAAHLLIGSFGSLLLAWMALRLLPLGRYQRGLLEAGAAIEVLASLSIAAGIDGHPVLAAFVAGAVTAALASVAVVTCLVVARQEVPTATWPLFATSAIALAFASVGAVRSAIGRASMANAIADASKLAWHGVVSAVGFVLVGTLAWSLAEGALRERTSGEDQPPAR